MTKLFTRDTSLNPARSVAFYALSILAAAASLLITTGDASATPPAAGDRYVYRLTDGYNPAIRGQLSQRVENIEGGRVTLAVTLERSGSQKETTEIQTLQGDWLRHAITSRDQLFDYDFTQAYSAYPLPLDPGKKWSMRVNAYVPATGGQRSLRVDAKIIGRERISVPAGEFDTVKIERSIYAGDAEYNLRETNTFEVEWYAPALGRSVRLVSKSEYRDTAKGIRNQLMRGDWNIFELTTIQKSN